MKQFLKRALLTAAALALVLGTAALVLLVTACVDPMAQKEGDRLALFAGLTADGAGTTSGLILIFSREIKGLSAEDITLEANGTGAAKGELASRGSGAYYLELTGVRQGGEVEVSVGKKAGYSIANPQRSVTVRYYADPAVLEEVKFISVAANGSPAETTTALTLVFDRDVEGLSAGDITLSGGARAVSLTANGGGEYLLAVSGIAANGGMSAAVAKEGYVFTPSSLQAAVHYRDPIPVGFLQALSKEGETTSMLTLVFDKEIDGLKASDIALSGSTGAWPWSLDAKGGGAYELSLAGLETGGEISVSVTKDGYAITGGPKTAPAYLFVSFTGLTANGSPTETTTMLALVFDREIGGLSAGDIVLSGTTGAQAGELYAVGGGKYELSVTGIAAGGQVTVSVEKPFCDVSPSKTVTVNLGPSDSAITTVVTRPQELIPAVDKAVFRNFSKSGGGAVFLSIANAGLFDRFEWFVGGDKIAEGDSIMFPADLKRNNVDVFASGFNWITVLAYAGAVPWSNGVFVWAND